MTDKDATKSTHTNQVSGNCLCYICSQALILTCIIFDVQQILMVHSFKFQIQMEQKKEDISEPDLTRTDDLQFNSVSGSTLPININMIKEPEKDNIDENNVETLSTKGITVYQSEV